jgi:hypothetical protein
MLVVLLLSAALLPAQTAAELERILALPAVSYGDAAWLILGAAGKAPGDNSAAYRSAADNGWLPQNAGEEDPATLGGLSFLIMRAFGIKGGLMYTLLPGPRYGYRELVYRKVIQGRAYSSMSVSGDRFLRILSRAIEYAGAAVPAGEAPDRPEEADKEGAGDE